MIAFWALVGSTLIVLAEFFVPVVRDMFGGSLIFLMPPGIFSLLGVLLLTSVLREKSKGKLKRFLILTAASATAFFISIFLHNLVYGLFIFLFGEGFWKRIGLGDEPLFFFIAIIVCPIVFLVGLIGSIVLLAKKKKQNE